MAFQLSQLRIPNMTTDFSAENSAVSGLANAVGNLPGDIRKQQIDQRKMQLEERRLSALGQAARTGDFNAMGRSLIGAGDVQGGAALLGLAQKQAERAQTGQILSQWGSEGGASGGVSLPGLGNQGGLGATPASAPHAADAQSNGLYVTSAYRGPDHPLTRANPNSPHAKGTAWDLRARTPEDGDAVMAKQRELLASRGLVEGRDYRIIDEVRNPARHATGPHIHVQLTPEGAARHRGGGGPPAPGVQVAETEADVQRLEAQMPGFGGGPIQTAQAPAQPGDPRADVRPETGAPTQGFAIPPGQGAEASISNDPKVQLWRQRFNQAAGTGSERLMKVAEKNLEMATKDAERRYTEGKAPEAVREWQWARQQGLTDAKSPVAYAKEKAEATRQDSAPTVRQLKQADGSEVAVQWNAETKTWDPLAAPKGGEAVRATGTKLTEGQSKDLIYHSRGLQALEAFEPLASAYADGAQRVASAVPGGNYVVSEEFQMAKQAGRNFLASVLRKDTGAAVTPSEEVLYGDIFLPQPGDKPGTLAQKSEARKQAIDAIRGGMGTAEVLALGKRLTTRQPGQDAPARPQPPPGQPSAPAQPQPRQPTGAQPTATGPNGQRMIFNGQAWVPMT